MPEGDVWLGIDLGTQGARVQAVGADGAVLGTGSHPLHGRRDGPRHEQHPLDWWRAVVAACGQALEGIDAGRIAGLAVDATSGTILLADAAGEPLGPALMYDDGRAVEQGPRADEAGREVWRRLGYQRMQHTWALPKLMWLAEHDAERAGAAGARLLHQPDLITWRLVGKQVPSDTSHALKTGYDLLEDRWPSGLLADLGVPAALLPEVVPPGTALGTVCREAAAQTGIPEGAVVVAGMTDGCAAQLGAGPLRTGAWNSVLGTTLVLKGTSDRLVHDPAGVVYCHRGPEGTWLPGGASSSGAGVLARRFPEDDPQSLSDALRHPPEAVAYPLADVGPERFPFRAERMEPFVLGEAADKAEHFHALLHGIACVERLCFDYLDSLGAPTDGPLTLTGGGARNRHLSQLRADLLGRPVRVSQASSAVGMAVLAASCESMPLAEAGAAMIPAGEEVAPRDTGGAPLRRLYRRFVDHLARRGWLDPDAAEHAHRRIERR